MTAAFAEQAVDSITDLLDSLEEANPTKRQVNVEGWPRPVWIWKITLTQVIELNKKRKLLTEGESGLQEFFLELLAYSLGDEGAPGAFATPRGRNWLRRQPAAVVELGTAARDFNEMGGPSADRKKESSQLSTSSPSVESLESDTLDD